MDKRKEQAYKVLELWEPFQYDAFRLINCILHDRYLTEDVLQDALIIAMEKYHTLRDKDKFIPWFMKIARRLAFKKLKSNRKHDFVEEVKDYIHYNQRSDFYVDETLLHVSRKDEVLGIFELLTPRERHLFHLRYIEDMSVVDIAKLTGIKLGTLKSIFHRTLKRLHDSLNQEQSI